MWMSYVTVSQDSYQPSTCKRSKYYYKYPASLHHALPHCTTHSLTAPRTSLLRSTLQTLPNTPHTFTLNTLTLVTLHTLTHSTHSLTTCHTPHTHSLNSTLHTHPHTLLSQIISHYPSRGVTAVVLRRIALQHTYRADLAEMSKPKKKGA